MPPTRKAARPAPPRRPRTQLVRTEDLGETPPDLSYIPKAVVEHFAARGLHASLASAHQDNAAALSLAQRYMVTTDELPEEGREQMLKEMARYAFRVDKSTGAICKGDCALYVQSFAAREAQIEEGHQQWLRQYGSDDRDAALIDQLNADLAGTKASVHPVAVGPLYEHLGWQE